MLAGGLQLAHHDESTGLANRRYLIERLDLSMTPSARDVATYDPGADPSARAAQRETDAPRSHGECTPSGGGAGAGAGRERVGLQVERPLRQVVRALGEHFVLAGDIPVAGLRSCHLTR